ncbi:MAG: hypothetical protein AB1393_12395 [Candidatus Edwardsbacteria bacterium]
MNLVNPLELQATADNRAYLASVLRTFAQIPRFARNFRYAQPITKMSLRSILVIGMRMSERLQQM